MKMFQFIKQKNKKIFKIFNFIFYQEISNSKIHSKYKNLLNLYSTNYKIKNDYTIDKRILFFKRILIKRIDISDVRYWYFKNKLIKKIFLKNIFKNKYFKYIPKKHDSIFLFDVNSGEMVIFLKFILYYLIQKQKSKNPLIIITKNYHKDLLNLFCPEIPYIELNRTFFGIQEKYFNIQNKKFNLICPKTYFKKTEEKIKQSNQNNYFNSLLKEFDCNINDIIFKQAIILKDIEENMFEKIKKINLNLNNFILLAPLANTCELIEENFWLELINKLKLKGYDIFINLYKKQNYLSEFKNKTCELSYSELFALAKYSKKIISLRSGLCEFLIDTNIEQNIIYTDFNNRAFCENLTSAQVLSGFSLCNVLNINKNLIKEFDFNQFSKKNLIELILN